MVLPTTLKKRHCLKGRNLLPAIRKLQDGAAVKGLARMMAGRRTEDLLFRDVETYVLELTDEALGDLLILAGRDRDDLEGARLLSHYFIVLANEKGQPQGQDLTDEDVGTSTTTQSNTAQGSGVNCVPTGCATVASHVQQPNKRLKTSTLEERISVLEHSTVASKIADLKERVRSLCLQPEPSNSLILLTLDELAKAARSTQHEESDFYEELLRQVHRLQSKICLPSLCLSVLGGNASDKISKAVAKCMKEVIDCPKESKKEAPVVEKTQTPVSPLENLYGSPGAYPVVGAYPFQYPMYGHQGYIMQGYGPQGYGQGYRNYRRGGFRPPGQRSRGACLVCDSTSHQVRDCPKVKEMRQK